MTEIVDESGTVIGYSKDDETGAPDAPLLVSTKITMEDIDKAADFYEDLIDKSVMNPSAENAAILHDCMTALDALNMIRNDIRRGYDHTPGDGK